MHPIIFLGYVHVGFVERNLSVVRNRTKEER
jgi:hypothetical protein